MLICHCHRFDRTKRLTNEWVMIRIWAGWARGGGDNDTARLPYFAADVINEIAAAIV